MTLLPTQESQHSARHCQPDSYGVQLLRRVGVTPQYTSSAPPHPAERMAASGLLALSGPSGQPPVLVPVPLASCADEALTAYRYLCQKPVAATIDGADLLTERACLAGLHRNGSQSTGGHCRLLPTASGTIAVNLARDSDWDLMPAWLQQGRASDWHEVARQVHEYSTQTLVEHGRLLGLAVADATQLPRDSLDWLTVQRIVAPVRPLKSSPRVIDLSSLWAGPLCSRLWQAAGAEVIKVESRLRPDGGRVGSPAFFEQLNRGKTCITLDLHTGEGQQALRDLILGADIVLEASRPRALRQMGIHAEDLIATRPGLTWVSITGHGRGSPQEDWIAYGDDAGIAAGLSAAIHQCCGQWLVCGDAIADPLTGIHAAIAGWADWLDGGGCLLDLSLVETVRHCITATAPEHHDYRTRCKAWSRHLEQLVPAPPPPDSCETSSSPR